jgi:hypothetical protein
MSFSAIGQQTDGQPPRVRIDVGTGDPSKPFTSLTILRDGKPIREQPFIGGSEVVAFDYEAPFGVPVTYSAVGEIATMSTVYATTWANLTDWTTTFGDPAVAGGRFYAASGTVARAARPITALSRGRLTVQTGSIGPAEFSLRTFTGCDVVLQKFGPGGGSSGWTVMYGNYGINGVNVGTGAVVMTFDQNGVSVDTTAGSWYVPRSGPSPEVLEGVAVRAGAPASRLSGFTVEEYATATFNASTVITPAFTGTWLIHPSRPALSCQIDGDDVSDVRFIDASSGESMEAAAQRTVHRPIGRRKAVVITSGPRQADEWTLVIGTETLPAKKAVRALVDDQTPLLLRSPADIGRELPDDWYSVGDYSVTRPESPVVSEAATLMLPLTPVDEPVVRQGALWTSGDVLLAYATAQEVLYAFDTALELLIGEPS